MPQPEAAEPQEPSPWERFEDFSKRLLAVPTEEIREKQAEYDAKNHDRKAAEVD